MTYKEQVSAVRYIAATFGSLLADCPPPEPPEDVSLAAVYHMSKMHMLHGMMFFALEEKIKLGDDLLAERWKREYNLEMAKHLNQKHEFMLITKLLSDSGVPYLPMKGFLMKALYPRPELRSMSDIDMYIPEDMVERAKELLSTLGYRESPASEVHDSMEKPPFMHVEIHRMLYKDAEISLDSCIKKEGDPCHHQLTDEDFFSFFLRHAKKHNEGGGCGVRTVFDLHLLRMKKPQLTESAEMAERLREEGLLEFYRDLSEIADFWFSGKPLSADGIEHERYIASGGAYGTYENGISLGMKKKGFLFVLGRIFPPYSVMSTRYPFLKACPILLPFMYPVRWIASLFSGAIFSQFRALRESVKNKDSVKEYNEKELADQKKSGE